VDAFGNKLVDPVIELKKISNPKGGGITVTVVGGMCIGATAFPGCREISLSPFLSRLCADRKNIRQPTVRSWALGIYRVTFKKFPG
jgi:hypothetical protein